MGHHWMRRLALAALLALAVSPSAYAKQCRNAAGKFVACPSAAGATASKPTSTASAPKKTAVSVSAPAPAAGGYLVCKNGKPCGDSCIAKDKVCHK
jgi:hypothetical protein